MALETLSSSLFESPLIVSDSRKRIPEVASFHDWAVAMQNKNIKKNGD